MLKKLLIATTGLALSAPVLAGGYGYGYRDYRPAPRVVYQPVYVTHRPVVVREYYRPAPAVVYQGYSPGAGAAVFLGAVLGAVVAHQIVTR